MKTMKRLMVVAMALGIMGIVVPVVFAQSTITNIGQATDIGKCPPGLKRPPLPTCTDTKDFSKGYTLPASKEGWNLGDPYNDTASAFGQSPAWPEDNGTMCPKCGKAFSNGAGVKRLATQP